jgi:hypothetical protein
VLPTDRRFVRDGVRECAGIGKAGEPCGRLSNIDGLGGGKRKLDAGDSVGGNGEYRGLPDIDLRESERVMVVCEGFRGIRLGLCRSGNTLNWPSLTKPFKLALSFPSSDSSDVGGVVGRLPRTPSPTSLSFVVAAECQLEVDATELADDGSASCIGTDEAAIGSRCLDSASGGGELLSSGMASGINSAY